MARKSKVWCDACGSAFRTSAGNYDEVECPHCGCVGEVSEYDGQDMLCEDEVFDLVDGGVIPCV